MICTTTDIKEITSIKIDPGVEVELTMTNEEEKWEILFNFKKTFHNNNEIFFY